MTIVGAPSASIPRVATPRSLAAAVLVPLATVVVVVALAILPLLTPLVMHPLLDAARAHDWLGVTPAVAHGLSDATVAELVLGPGTFAMTGPDGRPLYGPDEAAHLRDARLLLWLLLAAGVVSVVGLAVRLGTRTDRARTWRGIARGGAIAGLGTVALGVIGLVAFEPLFELFHRVFFSGGNWAFDPTTQRLVQLYPFAFWELASSALGVGVAMLGALAWFTGRRAGRTGTPMSTTMPQGRLGRLRGLLATRQASVIARSVGYLLIFVGFLIVLQGGTVAGLWLVLIGWLLTRAARANHNAARVASLLDGLRVADALDADPAGVAPALSLETLVEEDARQTGGSGVYPVRQAGDVLGVIDVLDADSVPRAEWGSTRVEQLMRPVSALDTVPPDQPLFDVVARFERTRREAFAVVDPADPGRLLGFVTRERVHALMRSRASRSGRRRGLAGR